MFTKSMQDIWWGEEDIWEVAGLSIRGKVGAQGSLFVFKDQMDKISLEDLRAVR